MESKFLNNKQILKSCLIVVPILLFLAARSSAEVTFTNDESAFNASNPGLALQNFESGNIPPSGVGDCDRIINENTNNSCFSPGEILPGIQFEGLIDDLDLAGPVFTKNPFKVLITDRLDDTILITFPGNRVNAAGLHIGCVEPVSGSCSDNMLVQVLGEDDALIGSTTVAVTNISDKFLGIKSNKLITKIILNVDPDTFNEIDRVSLASVLFGLDQNTNIPTLSEWGMIVMAGILGIAGFIVIRKKKVAI